MKRLNKLVEILTKKKIFNNAKCDLEKDEAKSFIEADFIAYKYGSR